MSWAETLHGALVVGVSFGSLISILWINIGIRRDSVDTLRRSQMLLEDLERTEWRALDAVGRLESVLPTIEAIVLPLEPTVMSSAEKAKPGDRSTS